MRCYNYIVNSIDHGGRMLKLKIDRAKYARFLIVIASLFVAGEYIFAILAQTAPLAEWGAVCFSSIVLAPAFCIFFAEKSLEYIFPQLALICTVCADYFLVYLEGEEQLTAMIFFSGTQIFYFLRLISKTELGVLRTVHLAVRLGVTVLAVLVTLLILGKGADLLSVVSVFYYAHLILNFIFAILTRGETPLFAIGLLLFIGCDTFVGFAMMGDYIPIAEGSLIDRLNKIPLNMAWVFYTPSQTLLALSLLPKKLKRACATKND